MLFLSVSQQLRQIADLDASLYKRTDITELYDKAYASYSVERSFKKISKFRDAYLAFEGNIFGLSTGVNKGRYSLHLYVNKKNLKNNFNWLRLMWMKSSLTAYE